MNAPPFSIICMFMILSGCIIPESNHVAPDFYLLSDVKNDDNKSMGDSEISFYLREIELPRYLKDSRMVSRPTDHTIEFRESKRWGEPLEDGIARAISLNIVNQVHSSQFAIFPNRRKDGLNWDISVTFSAFEKASEHIVIEAKWSAKDKSGALVTGSYSSALPLEPNGGESLEISTYNLALDKLAKRILSSLISS